MALKLNVLSATWSAVKALKILHTNGHLLTFYFIQYILVYL